MTDLLHLINYFVPKHYNLELDIDQAKLVFKGRVAISGNLAEASQIIYLNSEDLEIQSVAINQQPAKFTIDQDVLVLPLLNYSPAELEILIEFNGKITDQMSGIYPSYYLLDGHTEKLISTQFESHYARQVFPCLDEPLAKATFQLTLITDAGLSVLSNTKIINSTTNRSRQTSLFETSPLMSTYTLGFVIGDLIYKSKTSKSGIVSSIYATKAQSLASLDYGLEIASAALEWYQDYLGAPYPLEKCDHVAIPDFAAGAMENWGLVTYRESCLLASETTSQVAREAIATVIVHELAHMWFGNLVTMAWWDELWLNESLASILEYTCLDALHPEYNAWEDYFSGSFRYALNRDALAGVQPVLYPINHPDEISTAFDGAIVYSKGAAIMKMLENFIGLDNFRQALAYFLRKYAYQNPSSDDMLAAFSYISNQDLNSVIKPWLTQPGFPLITAQEKNGQTYLSQTQFGYSSSANWPIPINVDEHGLMTDQSMTIDDVLQQPLNKGARNYYLVKYEGELYSKMLTVLTSSKARIADKYYFLTCGNLLAKFNQQASSSLIDNLVIFSDGENNQLIWQALVTNVSSLKLFVESDPISLSNLKTLVKQIASEPFLKLPEIETSASQKLKPLLMGALIFSEDQMVIDQLTNQFDQFGVDRLEELPVETRCDIIGAKVRFNYSDKLFKQLQEIYATTQNPDIKADLVEGLTMIRDQAGLQTLYDRLLDTSFIKPQDCLTWFAYLSAKTEARTQAWEWLKAHFSGLVNQYNKNKTYDDFIRVIATKLNTSEELADFETFFKPYLSDLSIKRIIEVGIMDITNRVELIKANQADVRAKLADVINN